ncbi:hypothetical protein FPJ27_15075 [Burkholderia sp. MS455]|uniref:hypothetical protein n=1 Tax=Burkholderia sp. MS455 TaxID=2811788 RepID=UPI001959FB73|nr:hypothetical protein [Burkholderia sp. MS455]QRR07602.1 hypothetical protein FPJ27_15075 [Burkholderia sp. MS455]
MRLPTEHVSLLSVAISEIYAYFSIFARYHPGWTRRFNDEEPGAPYLVAPLTGAIVAASARAERHQDIDTIRQADRYLREAAKQMGILHDQLEAMTDSRLFSREFARQGGKAFVGSAVRSGAALSKPQHANFRRQLVEALAS